MSDTAAPQFGDKSPYQHARELAEQGSSGPEIHQSLLAGGVDDESARVLIQAVGAEMPPAEALDLEQDMKTAIRAVADVRQRITRDSVRRVRSNVKTFAKESLRFDAGDEQRLVKNSLVGGGIFAAGIVAFVVMYLSGVEAFPAYVAAGIVTALGGAHLLYGISHIDKK